MNQRFLKKTRYLGLSVCLLLFVTSCRAQRSDRTNADPTSYVNPFIGTAPLTDPDFIGYTPPEGWRVWAGLTYPGSSLPNAMVQLSPITEYGTGAGYEYEDREILGFTHTNKGHWNLCNIPILPLSAQAVHPFKSAFSHDQETASPAYYEVYLSDYQVKVRLSSTLRCGIHEYTWDNPETEKRILFDLGKANNRVSDWQIQQVTPNELLGFQEVGSDKIHFYVRLSHPIKDINVSRQGQRDGHAIVKLAEGANSPVTLKIGLSYVSAEGAEANLLKELAEHSFETIHKQGRETWRKLLSKITVRGGTEKQKEMFYSSLYRSFLWPALRSDVDGKFTDVKGVVQEADFNYYTNPSFWDTYRNKLVLLQILSPKVTLDIIKSLLDKGDKTGFIPTFFHGDHAAPFITGAWLRGLQEFDVEKAYQLLLNNAYKEGGIRPHITEYIEKGYVSDPDISNPHVESKGTAGVSKTLEYAYDDYSLALLAEALADTSQYRELMHRSQYYKNVFDTGLKFMRGRLEDGSWIDPFNPAYPYYEYMYREANAWQVSFFAPHDMPGLVRLYGGPDAFESKLDSLFSVPWNPAYIARNVSSFLGQYCHGNQPGHEAPFSYHFIRKPEKSQRIIDSILNHYYGVGVHGLALPGMDDAGEMSAWYVFTAMGIYPFSPADPEYLVTVPLFDEVVWNLDNGEKLHIRKRGKSRHLQQILYNEHRVDGYFVPHTIFRQGGQLTIRTTE